MYPLPSFCKIFCLLQTCTQAQESVHVYYFQTPQSATHHFHKYWQVRASINCYPSEWIETVELSISRCRRQLSVFLFPICFHQLERKTFTLIMFHHQLPGWMLQWKQPAVMGLICQFVNLEFCSIQHLLTWSAVRYHRNICFFVKRTKLG